MKVIGKAGFDKLIVEMTEEEFNAIVSNGPRQFEAEVGMELEVGKVYKKLQTLNKLQLNNGSYNSVRRQLEQMLESLTGVEDIIVKSNEIIGKKV